MGGNFGCANDLSHSHASHAASYGCDARAITDLRRQLAEAKAAEEIATFKAGDLQRENERIRKRWAHAHRVVNDLWALTDPEAYDKETRADIAAELDCEDGSCPLTREDRLKADNERLREAAEPFYVGHRLSQAVAGDWCQECHGDWPCKGEALRRAALAQPESDQPGERS